MASNFPGPYEVEIQYTVSGIVHKQRLNCNISGTPNVGDDPSTIDVLRRDGMTTPLDEAVDAWADLTRDMFNTSDSWDNYTLWKYADLSNDRTFITTGDLNLAGLSANPAVLAGQITATFRTFEGNNMRIVVLESTNTSNTRKSYTNASAKVQAIMDFVVGLTNWILARDTSYPIGKLASTGGQNEAVFKARFR